MKKSNKATLKMLFRQTAVGSNFAETVHNKRKIQK